MQKVLQGVTIARKRRYFAGIFGFELRSELGKLGVRHAGMPVVHPMIRLMEQSERYQPAE